MISSHIILVLPKGYRPVLDHSPQSIPYDHKWSNKGGCMMKSRLRASVPLAVLAATCLSTPSMALAQIEPQASQDRATIDDIVVTARRQSETRRSVPVQINVQTGEQLARTNATDLPKIDENITFVTITKISGGNGGGLIVRGLGAVG